MDIHNQRSTEARIHKETICDVHRDVYHKVRSLQSLSESDKNFILQRIETAFKMGKSMDAKLRQYKHNYDENWWLTARREWDWNELKGE